MSEEGASQWPESQVSEKYEVKCICSPVRRAPDQYEYQTFDVMPLPRRRRQIEYLRVCKTA